jgi:hypothetical protein
MAESFTSDSSTSAIANTKPEKPSLLFKYLDAQGAAAMLYNGNLQFTNAFYLNDPFDCHPQLIDFSKATPKNTKKYGGMTDIAIEFESHHYERTREEAWICCLSKVNNSLPMWTFYAKNHAGVCIGLDVDELRPHLNADLGVNVFDDFLEVEYRDIIMKPNHFAGEGSHYYQITTKAKEWEYEQEVRLIIFEPMPWIMAINRKPKRNEIIDGKEPRAYPQISDDCFAAIYLGLNILPKHKKRIIEIAKDRNPNIKIYQMKINPEALRLDCINVA